MYANVFNIFILVMEIAVVFFAIVAVLLSVALVVLHRRNYRERRRQEMLSAAWQEAFTNIARGKQVDTFPEIQGDGDRYSALLVFSSVYEFLRNQQEWTGQTAERLAAVGRKMQLDHYAHKLLGRSDQADRIIALRVLGELKDTSVFSNAHTLTRDPGLELSRTAALCALRLRPELIDEVLVSVRDRDDWTGAYIEHMLRETGPQVLDPAMHALMNDSDERGKRALLEFVGCCTPNAARAMCLEILQGTTGPELTAAALRALAPYAKPEDERIAHRYLETGEWFVRIAALRVLERVASQGDVAILERLVGDRDWWVRHRAAEVLVELQQGNSEAKKIAEKHPDRYARGAIAEAMAEYHLGTKES